MLYCYAGVLLILNVLQILPSMSEAIRGYDSVAFEATMTAILENTLTS